MTFTLALDTATDLGSIALGKEGDVVAEVMLGDRRHAAAAVPALQEVLRMGDATIRDVSRVLFADGPGSFTGLRIGLATVQGIARAHHDMTFGTAPSLLGACWAARLYDDGPIAALYDALRGDVYGAIYHIDETTVETIVPPRLGTLTALRDTTPVVPTLAVGDGAYRFPDEVQAWTGRRPVGGRVGIARASALLALDRLAGAVSEVPVPATFELEYGRPAEAQARWERDHGQLLTDPPSDGG